MTTKSETRREFNGDIAYVDQKPWVEWFESHGIVPASVPLEGGWVERDVEARQVRWFGFILSAIGRVQLPRNPDGTYPTGEERAPWMEEQCVQLESAPLPFPVDRYPLSRDDG
jgi:hypothetical protein